MSVTAVPLRPVKKGSVLKLWLGLALLALVAVGLAWIGTRSAQGWTRTASGLQIRTLEEGTGANPTEADIAFVTYTGRLADSGKVFDSNEGQQPVPFPVAEGATIKGFSEGLKLMKKGGSYRLRIPPELGYGDKDMGNGQIPPNSTLDFDVKVVEVMPEAQLRQMMMQQQMMQGGMGAPGGAGAPGGGEGPPEGAQSAPQGQ